MGGLLRVNFYEKDDTLIEVSMTGNSNSCIKTKPVAGKQIGFSNLSTARHVVISFDQD